MIHGEWNSLPLNDNEHLRPVTGERYDRTKAQEKIRDGSDESTFSLEDKNTHFLYSSQMRG